MGILINRNTRVLVQGITGHDGAFHTRQMRAYGTEVVAGTVPNKGGQTFEGIPIFEFVKEAKEATAADTAICFVPAKGAIDALYEAIEAGMEQVICISEHIPIQDMSRLYTHLKTTDTRLLGPNCPGAITPGVAKVGIMPGDIHTPGHVGVVSRSGTLTYEIVFHLSRAGIGQSSCVGIGGDPIIGTTFTDILKMFEQDPETHAVVMIGEIGGTDEEEATRFVKEHMQTPVVGFIAGKAAPPGKRMGHAGAIISGGSGTAAEKVSTMAEAGILIADQPADVVPLVQGVI